MPLNFHEKNNFNNYSVNNDLNKHKDIFSNELVLEFKSSFRKKLGQLIIQYINRLLSKDVFSNKSLQLATEFELKKEDIINFLFLLDTIHNIKNKNKSLIDFGLFANFLEPCDLVQIVRQALLNGSRLSRVSDKILQSIGTTNLVILTEVSWNTLGDYYAALRLIRLLHESYPSLTINWIIKGRESDIPSEFYDAQYLRVKIIEHWDYLFSDALIKQNLCQTAAIFIFPTFHFLSFSQLSQLKTLYQIPLISCLEYSYGAYLKHDDVFELRTGLGSDELGVFIFNCTSTYPLTHIDKTLPIIKILFPNVLNGYPPPEDALSPKHSLVQTSKFGISDALARYYTESTFLFFGYGNKELSRVINSVVNLENYVKLCLLLAKQNTEKNIDIIVPLSREAFLSLPINWQDYKRVSFISLVNGCILNETHFENDSTTNPSLRIINLFRFDNHTFTYLMAASHPFKMCTGDQSFSDAISLNNCIPFYQIMGWKKNLAHNYLAIAQHALKSNQWSIKKSSAIQFLTLIFNSASCDLNNLTTLLKNPQLVQEFNCIHAFIRQNKNLNQNLPVYLVHFLQYLKIEGFLIQIHPPHSSFPKKNTYLNEYDLTTSNQSNLYHFFKNSIKLSIIDNTLNKSIENKNIF